MSLLTVESRKFRTDLVAYTHAMAAAQAASEKKAERIAVLDLSAISTMADYFVICSVRTDTHARAVRQAVTEALEGHGLVLKSREGVDSSGWILLDAGDVIVHIFNEDQRAYYCLEQLWGDAPSMQLPDEESASNSLDGDMSARYNETRLTN